MIETAPETAAFNEALVFYCPYANQGKRALGAEVVMFRPPCHLSHSSIEPTTVRCMVYRWRHVALCVRCVCPLITPESSLTEVVLTIGRKEA